MQIDRLFQIVYILLDKNQVTAKELSDLFSVSTRTIYRDIDTLSLAGVPVYTNKGKGGGISLLDNFIMDKSVLSKEEQNKIIMGLEILKATQYENVDEAIVKLKALFHKSNENWIEVDFSHWGSSSTEKKKFEDLKFALINCKSIVIDYSNSLGEMTTRTVYPLKLVFKEKNWYLIAFCLLKNEVRVFKIHRIIRLDLSIDTFDRSIYKIPDMDLSLQKNINQLKLSIVLSSNLRHRVLEEFKDSEVIRNADGSFEITFLTAEDEWLYDYLLSFGSDIKIIEPSYLNDIIKNRLLKI